MRRAAVVALVLLVLATSTVASAHLSTPESEKLLARSTTTRSFTSASIRVYTRDDPEYRQDLRYYRAQLASAQAELNDARDSIVQVGELTPAQKRAQKEFLQPFVRAVADAKAGLADLAADYVKPFSAYGFRVAGSGPITLEWTVRCDRSRGDTESSGETTRLAPFTFWRAPTVPRAHSCYVRAFATQDNASRMVVSVLGRR